MSDNLIDDSLCAGQLVWRDKKDNIREYILHPGETATIGRETDNQIVLFDPMVSKRHAEIRWVEDEFVLRDLGSSNGTMLNGDPVYKPTSLESDSSISVGKSVLGFYILRGELLVERLQAPDIENQVTNVLGDMSWVDEIPDATPRPTEAIEKEDSEAKLSGNDFFALEYPESEPMLLDDEEQTFENGFRMEAGPEPDELPDLSETPDLSKIPNLPDMPKPPDLSALLQSADTVRQEIPSFLEDGFCELLGHIQAAQQTLETLRAKTLAMQNAVEESLEDLNVSMQAMKGLHEEAERANIESLFKELSNNPNDVRLLMELANNSDLLARLLRSSIIQRNKIAKIKTEMEFALKDDL